MRLLNDFFQIDKTNIIGDSYCCCISLNADHLIYKVHFPNNPITPGACLLQISKECLEQILEKQLFVDKIKNVKFLSVLSPTNETKVDIIYNKLIQTDTGCKVQIIIKSEETQYVKIAISYVYESS